MATHTQRSELTGVDHSVHRHGRHPQSICDFASGEQAIDHGRELLGIVRLSSVVVTRDHQYAHSTHDPQTLRNRFQSDILARRGPE